MSKQPPPAPTASAIGPCPTVIQIVGRPGTGSLPSTIAPPDHPPGVRGDGGWGERENVSETDGQAPVFLFCLLFSARACAPLLIYLFSRHNTAARSQARTSKFCTYKFFAALLTGNAPYKNPHPTTMSFIPLLYLEC